MVWRRDLLSYRETSSAGCGNGWGFFTLEAAESSKTLDTLVAVASSACSETKRRGIVMVVTVSVVGLCDVVVFG